MLKQNKKDKQDRHRWLLIGFLCLFGVCLVAQVRPTEQKTKATGTSTKSVADTSKTTKKQPENKKTKVYLLHADEGQAEIISEVIKTVVVQTIRQQRRVPVYHLYIFTELRNLSHSIIVKIITVNEQRISLLHTYITESLN